MLLSEWAASGQYASAADISNNDNAPGEEDHDSSQENTGPRGNCGLGFSGNNGQESNGQAPAVNPSEHKDPLQDMTGTSNHFRRPQHYKVFGNVYQQIFPTSSEQHYPSESDFIQLNLGCHAPMDWSEPCDDEADRATNLEHGVKAMSRSMEVTVFHGCEENRYYAYAQECHLRRYLSSKPSDHFHGRGVYYFNSVLYALIWATFSACAQRPLVTPLSHLCEVVIEPHIKLSTWTCVGKCVTDVFMQTHRFQSRRANRVDTQDVVISRFSTPRRELEWSSTDPSGKGQ